LLDFYFEAEASAETSRMFVIFMELALPALRRGAAILGIPLLALFTGDLPPDEAGEVQDDIVSATCVYWIRSR